MVDLVKEDDDPMRTAMTNIHMALKIINHERLNLFNQGIYMAFEPTMTGGITVALKIK